MSVGNNIQHRRVALGLTKAGLARQVGCSDVTIGYWESGKICTVSSDRLLSAAAALGCSVSELVDDPALRQLKRRWIEELAERLEQDAGLDADRGKTWEHSDYVSWLRAEAERAAPEEGVRHDD